LVNNKPLYLVKWKNLSSKENSYVKPEDFANMKFVNDYLKNINNSVKTRSRNFITPNTVMQVSLLIILFFPVIFGYDIPLKNSKDFDYCPLTQDLMPINLEEICTNPNSVVPSDFIPWFYKYYSNSGGSSDNKILLKKRQVRGPLNNFTKIYAFQAFILAKSVNKVSGKAFQCKRIISI